MGVDIIDIGGGNVKSIKNWVERLNVAGTVVHHPLKLSSNILIIPGVGSVAPYMERLRNSSFDKAILEHVENGGRVIGICLGFQIMAESSDEDGGVQCLSILKGKVEKNYTDQSHNGWETIQFSRENTGVQNLNSELNLSRKKILKGRVFYNHQYSFVNYDDTAFSLRISASYSKYTGMLVKDRVIGFQFHPEKSQATGLNIAAMVL